jgi:hypothetical protein
MTKRGNRKAKKTANAKNSTSRFDSLGPSFIRPVAISRGVSGLPFTDRFDVVLPYVQSSTIVTGGTLPVAVVQQWRTNSLFDPDYTGVGHQPYQFDQIKTMYSFYRVERMDYEIEFITQGVAGLYAGINILFEPANTVADHDFSTLLERSECRMQVVPTTGDQRVVMKGTVWPWMIMGLSKEAYMADPSTISAITTSPAYSPLIEAALVDPLNRSSLGMQYTMRMRFHARMSGYLAPDPS